MPSPTRAFVALLAAAGTAASVAVALPASTASAAPPDHTIADTVGTEFWTAISEPLSPTSAMRTLYVSPTTDGSVTVSDRAGGVIATRALTAGHVEAISLSGDRDVTETDGVGDDGVHVVATGPVSVYATVIDPGASTGFQLYPLDALGTSYRALGYVGLGASMGSRMTVVATADATAVTITPKTTVDARTAGTPYVVNLDRGQTYQLTGTAGGADVTGTSVESDKPVALLSGAGCANVPAGAFACNPLVQQAAPTSAWGTEFVSARLATRAKGDTYRVLADEDGTVVSIAGVAKATIDAGEFYEAVLPEGATTADPGGVLIQTSAPALVAQYGNGTSYDGTTGDPMMVTVAPAGQLLTSYVVAAPDVSGQTSMQPYLNIVAQTRDLGQVLLNGAALPAEQFTAVAGSDYSITQMQVDAGQYSVAAPHQVGVTVYELGDYDGFGFPGGQALAPIADAPAPPTAAPLTSTGTAGHSQSVTIPLGAGQTVTLVDGAAETNTVAIPDQGTYTLAPGTGVITFTPRAGFVGTAAAVTYRIRDSYNQFADSSYAATVGGATGPKPPGKVEGTLALPALSRVANNRKAQVTATCRAVGAVPAACTVTLTASVRGATVTTGRGTWRGTTGAVRLNAVGRSLAATVGGRSMKAAMVLRTTTGQQVAATARGRVVAKRFTLARTARFASESTTLAKRDRSWLRQLGRTLGPARMVICTGYTDAQGDPAYNRALSYRRAAATCAAVHAPHRVRVVVKARGSAGSVADNGTSAGRAHNRRVTLTLTY